jgi:hypothetical protein
MEPIVNRLSHPASLPIPDLLNDCSIQRTRGSGPGGQHRNKVETAIVITHRPTGVTGQASEKRSQNQNREVAIERLRVNLALAVRSKIPEEEPDAAVFPSELWKSRVHSMKLSVSLQHTDYPALLAEALDQIVVHNFDVAKSAKSLSVSTSQLVKFLKTCPSALELVNRERLKQGLNRLN